MKIEFITDISIEPVDLAEVKAALKITGLAADNELERLISDARMYVEKAIDTSVMERDIKVTSETKLEDWELPFGPVKDIESSTEYVLTKRVYVYNYVGGYASTPSDIRRLIINVVKFWYDIDDTVKDIPDNIRNMIQLLTRQPGL
jgi:hypothetical protein